MKTLATLAIVLLAACGDPDTSVPEAVENREPSPNADMNSPLPAGVQVNVLEESTVPGARRSLDVRVSRRVSEVELRAIAEHLKDRDPNQYDRTFIVYYLPGMEPGAGGWATSRFDPDLEVSVLGSTIEQEQSLASADDTPSGEDLIGVWASDQPYMPARITLYREGDETFILQRYSDGSGSPAEVVESHTSSGRRYEEPGSNGDYFLVTSSGMLEIRDSEGLITSLRPVQ